MCAGWKVKTWNLSLGGSRGTQGDVRHSSVHVQVTCAKRPMRSRRMVGAFASAYGAKFVVTRKRAGSTSFVSATIAIFAVIASPKRWTVGLIVAYALNGSPSPTEEPFSYTGRRAAAGTARTSAAAAASGT